jgi:hypothetical protein
MAGTVLTAASRWLREKIGSAISDPLIPYLLLLILAVVLVYKLTGSRYTDSDFLEGVLIEAYGTVMDILFLGVFVGVLHKVGERHRRIRAYREEIEDLSGLIEPAAAHRIAALLRRLTNLRSKPLNLSGCFVDGIHDLQKVDLSGCMGIGSRFAEARLWSANLEEANFSGSVFEGTQFISARMRGVNLINTNCRGAWFKDADLRGAILVKALLEGVVWEDADLEGADIRKSTNVQPDQLIKAKNVDRCRMDDHVKNQIQELNRHGVDQEEIR